MKDTYGNTNKKLRRLAEEAAGLHYKSVEADKILDQTDWQNHWPVIDADGELTGDVVETDDCDNYVNVGDMAMIDIDDLPASKRRTIEQEKIDGTYDGYVDIEEA